VSDGSGQIRILAVDDHALVRQGIAVLVETQADMALVAEASNGREAIQQFRTHRPDITLMDLQMPEMNGFDAMLAIRGEFPDARIIVLTQEPKATSLRRPFTRNSLTPFERFMPGKRRCLPRRLMKSPSMLRMTA